LEIRKLLGLAICLLLVLGTARTIFVLAESTPLVTHGTATEFFLNKFSEYRRAIFSRIQFAQSDIFYEAAPYFSAAYESSSFVVHTPLAIYAVLAVYAYEYTGNVTYLREAVKLVEALTGTYQKYQWLPDSASISFGTQYLIMAWQKLNEHGFAYPVEQELTYHIAHANINNGTDLYWSAAYPSGTSTFSTAQQTALFLWVIAYVSSKRIGNYQSDVPRMFHSIERFVGPNGLYKEFLTSDTGTLWDSALILGWVLQADRSLRGSLSEPVLQARINSLDQGKLPADLGSMVLTGANAILAAPVAIAEASGFTITNSTARYLDTLLTDFDPLNMMSVGESPFYGDARFTWRWVSFVYGFILANFAELGNVALSIPSSYGYSVDSSVYPWANRIILQSTFASRLLGYYYYGGPEYVDQLNFLYLTNASLPASWSLSYDSSDANWHALAQVGDSNIRTTIDKSLVRVQHSFNPVGVNAAITIRKSTFETYNGIGIVATNGSDYDIYDYSLGKGLGSGRYWFGTTFAIYLLKNSIKQYMLGIVNVAAQGLNVLVDPTNKQVSIFIDRPTRVVGYLFRFPFRQSLALDAIQLASSGDDPRKAFRIQIDEARVIENDSLLLQRASALNNGLYWPVVVGGTVILIILVVSATFTFWGLGRRLTRSHPANNEEGVSGSPEQGLSKYLVSQRASPPLSSLSS
jgi:hypothetical protein